MSILRAVGYFAGHLALLGVFFGAAFCAGRALLARFEFPSAAAKLALCTILGLGALGTALFALGALGLLDRPEVLILLASCYASAWPRRRRVLPALRLARELLRPPRARIILAAGVAVTLGLAVSALYPPLDADSTMYHLPVAKTFAATHGLPAMPDLRYPVFPQFHELLAAAALLVGDDLLAQLVNVLWCLLVVATLFAWADRLGDRRVGVASALIWLGSPLVLVLARTTFVELAVVGFATAAALAADIGLESGKARWFAVAGALAGCAAAIKYTGLYFVAALAIVALAGRRAARTKSLGAFALFAIATGGPWYARNFLLSGDPVWPFLGGVFGYRFWTARDVASAVWTLRSEGGPRTPWAFLRLPWALSWHQHPRTWLSPALFTLFFLAILGLLRRNRRRWVFALILGYLVFWFLTTQQIRFLLPIAPLAALAGVESALWIVDRLVGWTSAGARRAATAVLAAAVLAPSLVEVARAGVRRGVPPTDTPSRDRFLSSRLPSYALYRSLNRERGSSYTIYAFYDERMKYYCDGRQVGDWFGEGRYLDVSLVSGEALLASLKRFGAEYLLVNETSSAVALPDDAFFRAHFERIYENGPVKAFRLR